MRPLAVTVAVLLLLTSLVTGLVLLLAVVQST